MALKGGKESECIPRRRQCWRDLNLRLDFVFKILDLSCKWGRSSRWEPGISGGWYKLRKTRNNIWEANKLGTKDNPRSENTIFTTSQYQGSIIRKHKETQSSEGGGEQYELERLRSTLDTGETEKRNWQKQVMEWKVLPWVVQWWKRDERTKPNYIFCGA